MITTILAKEFKEIAKDPKEVSLKEPYLFIRTEQSDENLTIVQPGKNGSEFNKTIGFFNNYPAVLIYRCVYGQGLILIQKNDFLGDVKEVKVASLRPGSEVEIPSGYGHCLINTGKNLLVTIDNSIAESKYKQTNNIIENHGLIYYVVDKKGEIGFEPNPHYPYHPQISTY